MSAIGGRGAPRRTAAGTAGSPPAARPAAAPRGPTAAPAGWPAARAARRARSPVRAASMASTSYAVTACTRPSISGASGATGTGCAPARSTSAGTSTTASSGRPAIVAVVAHVHVVVRAVAGQQRGDQRRGGLAVVGAAALLQQLRLVVERRVGVHRRAGSARSPAPPRPGAARSAARRPPGRCSRSSAGSTTGSRRSCAAARPACSVVRRPARRRRSPIEQLGQPVDAVDEHPPDPGQVVQPGVVEPHPVRRRPRSCAASRRWNPIADVAQPERAVAVVEQCPGDDADRVGEVDDPGVRLRALRRRSSAMPSTTGTVRSALAKPPGPVVSWPSSPNLPGSVSSTSRACLAADPQLDQHRGRAVDRVVQRGRGAQPAGEPLLGQDAPGQRRRRRRAARPRCRAAPARRRQHAGPAGEALDQLGRVRAAATDDRDLHGSSAFR